MSYGDVEREAAHDYYDSRREDALFDAIEEARYEEWAKRATECPNCGMLWDVGYHPATRSEPAWAEQTECPSCGLSIEDAEAIS